jgi:hypothetical protein
MVKLGPDLLVTGTDSYSGYLPNGNFSGFSMMHEQGTGGAPKYGTVAQLPLVGNISNPLSNITVPRSLVADQGSVGYYKAVTGQQVVVEMVAASRAGMYQYTFPAGSGGNNILIDVSHVLPSFRGQGLGQNYGGGTFKLFPDGHYEASGIYNNGWNRAPDWTIYSCMSNVVLVNSNADPIQVDTSTSRLLQPTFTPGLPVEAVSCNQVDLRFQIPRTWLSGDCTPSVAVSSPLELGSLGFRT